MSNTEIQKLISSFATQLEALAKRAALEQVIATLGASVGAAPKRGPGRPKSSSMASPTAAPAARPAIKAVRKGKRRTQADVEAMGAVLIDYVKANPGQRADQIAKALKTDPGTIRLPMQALLASKKVKTQGARRGTRYYVAGAVPSKETAKKK